MSANECNLDIIKHMRQNLKFVHLPLFHMLDFSHFLLIGKDLNRDELKFILLVLVITNAMGISFAVKRADASYALLPCKFLNDRDRLD